MAEEKQQATSAPSKTFPVFSIWPPNQKTRDAVIQRLVETLSTPSVLSKRYGVMNADEAASIARILENQAFVTANESPSTESPADDSSGMGIDTLQVYSKEISKLMLDAVKSRASSAEKPAQVTSVESESVNVENPSEGISQSTSVVSESTEN